MSLTIVQEASQLKTFFRTAGGLTVHTSSRKVRTAGQTSLLANHPEVKSEAWLGLCSEVHHEFLDPKKTSSLTHLLRVTSWVFRFVTSCRHKNEHVKVTKGPLFVEELMSAEEFWIKKAQAQAYFDDLTRLAAGKEVHCSSDLRSCTLTQTRRAFCASEVD